MMHQKGRSMVEMLGVLAVIGVLSAGGLTGYSKAMFQHKLNRQKEQYALLIQGLVQYQEMIKELKDTNYKTRIATYNKLNIIPKDMIKGANSSYIYDAFQFPILFGENGFRIYLTGNTERVRVCEQILPTFSYWHNDIYVVGVYGEQQSWYYGQGYCYGGRKCVKDIDMSAAGRMCSKCETNTCSVYVQIVHYN